MRQNQSLLKIGMRRPAGNMSLGIAASMPRTPASPAIPAPTQSVPFAGPQGGGPAGEPGGGGPQGNFSAGPSGVAGPGVIQSIAPGGSVRGGAAMGPIDAVSNPFHPTVAHAVGTLGLHSPPQQWYRSGGGVASAEQDPGVAGPGDPARLLDPVEAFIRSQQAAPMSPLLAQLAGSRGGGYYQSGG